MSSHQLSLDQGTTESLLLKIYERMNKQLLYIVVASADVFLRRSIANAMLRGSGGTPPIWGQG